MRIRKLETYTKGHLSIVRVETEDGSAGFGQIAPANADISALVFHRQVAPRALGADAMDAEAVIDRVIDETYKFPGTYVRRALAGLDTALWDLRGKREGKSVCELWGSRPGAIRAYGSSMRRDILPAEEADRMQKLREERGFGAFKLKIARRRGRDIDEWPGRTEELVRTLRARFGDDVQLLVDANSGYTPAKAIEVGRMLEDHGVCHFEEPCPYWEYDWTAEVTAALDLPVAGGEQDCFLYNWRRMVEGHVVDVIQPDVCYIGGPTRARRVAGWGAEAGLPCTPHSANVSMVLVFTLHLLAAIPNAGPYVEYSIESGPWSTAPYSPVPEVVDGKVTIPEGPGWGVEIDTAWLASADRQVSEVP